MAAGSTFDFLLPIIRAAQKVGRTPLGLLVAIDFTHDTGAKVCVPLGLVGLVPAHASHGDVEFEPNPLQIKILRFLEPGTKSTKQVRQHVGAHMYDAIGGMDDIVDIGWVTKKLQKYSLTDVGRAIAADLGDDDSEG
jgi:hypothetical protein